MATCRLDVPVVIASLVDEDQQFFESQLGLEGSWAEVGPTPLDHSFCQVTVGSEEPLPIEDPEDHRLDRDEPVILNLGVVAYLAFPLMNDDGHMIGSLCAVDHQPDHGTDQRIADLRDLARITGREMGFRADSNPAAEAIQLVGTGGTTREKMVVTAAHGQRRGIHGGAGRFRSGCGDRRGAPGCDRIRWTGLARSQGASDPGPGASGAAAVSVAGVAADGAAGAAWSTRW